MSTLTDTETLTGPVARAAAAAAAVLPAVTPLVPGTPVPGAGGASAGFAGAVVTELHLPGAPRVAVLVGTDLVEALASSPLGGLDLAAATQPALDAAAAALGTGCGAAREVSVALVDADLGGPFVLVPLLGAGVPCGALLVADAAVAAAGAVGAVVPGEAPVGSPVPPAAPIAVAPVVPPAVPASLPSSVGPVSVPATRGIEMLHGVDLEVAVELGRTRMTVRDLLALSPGEVLELDRAAGSPADLLVNGRLIARGEVVVVEEDFGLRITEIVDESAAG
nr:flagellar motor switch protein FliN [uncultured Nocardioides sp.]